MSPFKLFFTLFFVGALGLAQGQDRTSFAYNLDKPDQTLQLPKTLLEISGLTAIEGANFMCVQDEKGIVFVYDSQQNKIIHQYDFHLGGDYEGVTKAGNSIYILRSDGLIFEISNFADTDFEVNYYGTNIPAKDNEGLCYDAEHNRLLIASKSRPQNEPKNTPKRVIYGFDLNTKMLSDKPVYEFNIDELEAYAEKHQIGLPGKKKADESRSKTQFKFKTSAIAIHPITQQLYLLSAKDHFLFIFNPDGSLSTMIPLDPERFNKAEGITFYENGDMIITNEGDNDEGEERPATALRFTYNIN